MNADIYVQSCGIAQEHDYHWRKIINNENQPREIPLILKEAIRIEKGSTVRITDKYNSQKPSVVLANHKGKLLLLLTALEAMQRTKIYGRQVRNSIALVTIHSPENEQALREIVNFAEQDWESVRRAIDEAVTTNSENGFEVNRELIEQNLLINKLENSGNSSSIKPNVFSWEMSDKAEEGSNQSKKKLMFLGMIAILLIVGTIIAFLIIKPQTEEKPQRIPIPQSLISPQPPIPVTTLQQ
ncbi:hypothetical protein [Floridanema evergladense]|uniref:Uncharacterized protein n=1 Tax=Floridaenema evergladense BLCC-F167 TaxID=3153639 RepID=A0ABV4WR72_9CYAN